MNLKTKDVETRESGAGHVGCEAYLYYLDSCFKNEEGGTTHVMLVPEGGRNITVFQRNNDIKMDYYLQDVSIFYHHKSGN